jgi:subtilisin family serine protease
MLEIGMKRFVHRNALASAVGLALAAALFQPVTDVQAAPLAVVQQAIGSETYIVSFSEDGLLYYQGNVQGFAATGAPQGSRARKLDVHTTAAQAYDNFLATARATHVAAIESTIGRALDITHSYSITLNGIAADMTAGEAARIATVPGVKSVKRAGFETLATFRGPKFIGAGSIWDGSATPGNIGTRGEGVIVGDLDGGTNSDHPSFANDATCGFSAAAPKLTAVDCSASSGGVCTGNNPEANPGFGHGVHTSSTAAGNTIDNTVTPAPALPDGVTMSGVAPCAAIYQYKVCATNSCSGAAILAGVQNAIADQVDVVNFSISGGTDPWSDNDRNFLDMVNADIFVAAAAGNLQTGETDPTSKVNHLGPWVTTVAASSQDEVLSPILAVVGPGTPPATLSAIPLTPSNTTTAPTPAYDDKPIKSYPDNLAACSDHGGIPPHTFDGAIALVRRGPTEVGGTACSFVEKVTNAANAGAVMVIVANNQPGPISMDTTGTTTPSYSIDLAPGDALIAFVGDNESDAIVDTTPSGIGNVQGDVLANFSYRGPTLDPYSGETKPDITAPGVNIYAAFDDQDNNYGLDSGTSMATPHITGSAALIRAVHPDWTPTEVKSVLLTTATNEDGTQEDGTTPWNIDQVGHGRVDLTKAALAGLTLDETYQNYLDANPNGGSIEIRDLNLPSVRDAACDTAGCSWTRTVTNRLTTEGSWTATFAATVGDADATVSPSSFTLAAGATQTLTITATPSTTDADHFAFGNIVLHESSGASPDQHITVAVKPSGTPPPPTLCNNGACVLQIDTHTDNDANINALGAGAGTYFVYLNRFTPDATDYPFTLTNVQTVFVGDLSNGDVGAVVGELFDVYVYQDNDNDPSNGATLVAAMPGVAVADPLGAVQTITLPNGGVQLDGPGDVLIALEYHGALGAYPATGDITGLYQQRSWIGDVHSDGINRPNGNDEIFADGFDGTVVPPTGPDLVAEHMALVSDVVPTFTHNFIVRGNGTKEGGQPVNLGPSIR